MAELVRKARAGVPAAQWLHRLLVSSGYVAVAERDEDAVLVTTKQLARRLGVTQRTVQLWAREDMPLFRANAGNRAALYDAVDVMRWLEERKQKGKGGSGDPREELYREQARRARRQNDIEEGTLYDVTKLQSELAEIGRVFREGADAIERMHGAEVGDAIRSMIDQAEREWKQMLGVG